MPSRLLLRGLVVQLVSFTFTTRRSVSIRTSTFDTPDRVDVASAIEHRDAGRIALNIGTRPIGLNPEQGPSMLAVVANLPAIDRPSRLRRLRSGRWDCRCRHAFASAPRHAA